MELTLEVFNQLVSEVQQERRREKLRNRNNQYRKDHAEEARARNRKYYAAHRDEIREKARKRESELRKTPEYREYHRKYMRKWRAEHPIDYQTDEYRKRHNEYCRRYRAKLKEKSHVEEKAKEEI